ncbi:MAG TPA: hypothetical protein VMH87_07420 [Pseudomonadales bacterium]|nr:hypothetical protein [Pseudomonadales bacterium]
MGDPDPNSPKIPFFKTTIVYAIWRCIVEWSFAPLANYLEQEWGTVKHIVRNALGICLLLAALFFYFGYLWKGIVIQPLIDDLSITNANLSGQVLQLSNDNQRLQDRLDKSKTDFAEQIAGIKSDYNEKLREKDAENAKLQGQLDAALMRNTQLETTPETVENMYLSSSNMLSQVQITAQQSQARLETLTNIEERTSDIQRLPYGRTMFGGVLAGSPKVVLENVQNGLRCVAQHDLKGGLSYFEKAITAYESTTPSGVSMDNSASLTIYGKKMLYSNAGLAALGLGSNYLAFEYAKKADNISSDWISKTLLVGTAAGLAYIDSTNNNFSNSFELFQVAITNWESIDPTNKTKLAQTSMGQTNMILALYQGAAVAALNVGRTNDALNYIIKMQNISPVFKFATNAP